jgi:retron-type reverse transcriptase
MKVYKKLFNKVISLENLFLSWGEFKRGKSRRADVLEFEFKLEENIFALQRELADKTYKHSPYSSFRICDPKPRLIHKAAVRDRLIHHAIFRVLNPIFEPMFIPESFSCRIGKGHHRGFAYVNNKLRKMSANNTRICFALKCDIRKFFASVDHNILKKIIRRKIKDENALWLIDEIIDSHATSAVSIAERERERVKSTWRAVCPLAI